MLLLIFMGPVSINSNIKSVYNLSRQAKRSFHFAVEVNLIG